MNGARFIRRVRKLGRKRGVSVEVDASRGKGSHGALVKAGHRPIIIPRKLKKGTTLEILKRIDEVVE